MKAILVGSAASLPIPRPGCVCPQCEEARADPSLGRTRSALYVRTPDADVLVDASPDAGWQFEKLGVAIQPDAVILTHRHLDHVLGLSDVVHLRPDGDAVLPVYVGEDHRPTLRVTFRYLLREDRPRIRFEDWGEEERVSLGGIAFEGFETGHRERFPTTGVILHVPVGDRTARIAYATDMGDSFPTPRERLEGVDLFVGDGTYLGAAGYGHPGTDRVLAIARELGAKRIALTHVGHWQVPLDEARARLGDEVVICRDGDDLCTLLADV